MGIYFTLGGELLRILGQSTTLKGLDDSCLILLPFWVLGLFLFKLTFAFLLQLHWQP